MTCSRKDIERLIEHGAGRLTAAEKTALDQHLRDCPECRAIAAAQQSVWNALDDWPAAPLSDDFDQRLYARIARAESESSWQRFRKSLAYGLSWRASFAMAGACAVLLAMLLLRGPLADHAGAPSASVPAQKTVDIDQVESALDDVDMLNQLGAAAPAPEPAGRQSGS